MPRIDFTLPELGIDDQPIVASLWHVRRGSRVIEGDSLLEVRLRQRDRRSARAGERHGGATGWFAKTTASPPASAWR